MAFGPKKKHSKSRSKTRTTNWIVIKARKLKERVALNNEGSGLSHFIDENGIYNGKQVLNKKTKQKKVSRI